MQFLRWHISANLFGFNKVSYQDVLFKNKTLYWILEHPISRQGILFYQILGRPISHTDVLLDIRTSYCIVGLPVSYYYVLFHIRSSYQILGRHFTLGRPASFWDVLFRVRTPYFILCHQGVLSHIRMSYFILSQQNVLMWNGRLNLKQDVVM